MISITNYKGTNRTQTFTYDALNRITSGWSAANTGAYSWGENYSIDAWGNLQISPMGGKAHGGSFTLSGNAQNRPTGLAYDAAGNLMSYLSSTYIYDQENRLSSTAGMSYTYDGNGERVLKSNTSTGAVVKRYWSMGGNTLAEGDGSGNLTAEYIYFGGKRVARIDLPANTVHYYLSDHLKSTNIVASTAGAIEEESDYYPFGTEVVVTGGVNELKFTGKRRDTESQLDYFGARYYSNAYGRFLTPDWAAKATAVPYAEFADPQSLNLYSYVRNVPTTRFDADGHFQSLIDKVSPLPPPPPTPPSPSVPKDVASVNVPGPQYKTVDQAAKTAIRSTNHKSVSENKEIAGRVVKNSNGTYGVTKGPESGRAVASSEPGDAPKGTVNAGIWHDHGAATPGYDNEHFSDSQTSPLHLPGDKDLARSEHVPIYVGTPGGTIRKYDPATGQDKKIGNTPN